MRTQLGTYCQQFDDSVRPLLLDLGKALRAIDDAPAATPGTRLRGELADLQHQLQSLCDKVAQQQAYVLIFGPLKSGKSTLMNSIAGAYVSEVSSLPAYPCLVFVSAGKERDYAVASYDGRTEAFRDARDLHRHIDQAHSELAQAIRSAEQRGEQFDPQEHFPSAIRRVDVHVPDSELATTGAVLVDTPGLYTRMRFGYDRMTRDFRNAAACAIFVVKSDTLFLEQVFAEFQQLLDLFSRIFLVVNVDSHKRDVSPDGKLVPSLEQSQPEAVLRAFEQLAMSAPLQQAASEGRVKMYPVDLLHAASSVLQKQPADRVPPSFAAFRKDLADYLASSEYLAAFLRDSLQRGRALLAEANAAAVGEDVAQLRQRIAALDAERTRVVQEQARLQRVQQFDWAAAFARGIREVDAELERCARDSGAKLLRTLGASIDTWFLSSHSLDWLVTGQWNPLVRDYREDVLAAGRRTFEIQLSQADAGIDAPDEVRSLLDRAGVDLRSVKARALGGLGAVRWPSEGAVPVDIAAIPLRKGMLDLVAFRSLDKVRERVFGPTDKPDAKIPAKDKAARLGEPGRLHLHQCITQYRGDLAPQTTAVLREFFGPRWRQAASALLLQELAGYGPRLQQRLQQLDAERAQLGALAEPLQLLGERAQRAEATLAELGRQFDLENAATAAPAPKTTVLEPQPRRDRAPASEPQRRDQRRGSRT
ncbi:MAG: dynamin family protein [Planctomycetes bacterium]|nr:dynamin family protein [Planctomycetota bacterium]